jgi:cytochrome b6
MGIASLKEWLNDRLGLQSVLDPIEKKNVPVHRHTIWYYFGGMTLFFFMIQVATGILLMLYYRPSANEAFESVQFLMTQVPFGWLIRSIHAWSANLMIATAFMHMFSAFFLKAYRAPREGTWMTGVILLVFSLGFGFSGYLLPWNELAFFATSVGTDIAGSVPVVGDYLLRFLRGGDYVTGGTLSRFYGWHVAILPAITTLILLVHLVQVQRHGMSVPPGIERSGRQGRPMPFFPDFALRDLLGWTVALGVLGALAAIYPWDLGQKADPFSSAPANIRPEWYFMFMFQTLKEVPGGSVMGIPNEALVNMGFGIAGLLAFLVPFLDRNAGRRGRSPLFAAIGFMALLYMMVMTAIGYHAMWPIYAGLILALGPWGLGLLLSRNTERRR